MKPKKKPKKKQIMFQCRINPNLYFWVREYITQRDMTWTEFCEIMIRDQQTKDTARQAAINLVR